MLTNDILSVLISIHGVEKATKDLQVIQDNLQEAADSASALAAAGAGIAIAGGLLATASVIEAEKFTRLEKSLGSVTDAAGATRLAEEIQSIARDTGVWDTNLESVAETWADITGSSKEIEAITRSVANLSAANKLSGSEMERIARSLADAYEAGEVSRSNINTLRNAGAPVAEMAQRLGLPSINDAKGMDAAVFIQAFIDSVQDAEKTFSGTLRSAAMTLQHSLIPTGKLIDQLFLPIAELTRWLAGLLLEVNKFTRGWAGLAVVTGLVGGGLYMIWVAGKMFFGSILQASAALQVLAASATAASGANAAQGATSAAGGVTAALSRIGPMIATAAAAMWASILPSLIVMGKVLLVALAILAVVALVIYVLNGISNLIQGRDFNAGVGEAIGNVKSFFTGGGGSKSSPSRSTTPADRPIQRSSIENVWDKAYGRRMAT